jgi:hypothetical protein
MVSIVKGAIVLAGQRVKQNGKVALIPSISTKNISTNISK